MDSVKLSHKSFDELNILRESIESNPKNKNIGGGFHIYTPYARQKLDKIAWAITYKLGKGDAS